MTRFGALLVAAVTLLVATISTPPAARAEPSQAGPPTVAGTWQGDVDVMGQNLRIIVTLTGDTSDLKGKITIPQQGATDLPLDHVSFDNGTLKFSLAMAGAHWELTIGDDPSHAEGVLKQSGMELPTTLTRAAEGEKVNTGLDRPQTPKPPFPYATREVVFRSSADQTQLAGTICLPAGVGPHPVVVFITGSGPQDRDETLFGHKPFLVLADDLARHGVASLRYDDRGVGGSQGVLSDATIDTFVGDVLGAIESIKNTPELDASRIGLIGHSEGGIVAPAVAAASDDVSFIVLLAGTGVPGDEVLRAQVRAMLEAGGADEAMIQAQLADQKKTLDLIEDPDRRDELTAHIRSAARRESPGVPDAALEQIVQAQADTVSSPWFRAFVKYDPRVALRRVTCPVLALNGSLDLQVVPAQNLPAILTCLQEAGCRDITIHELPGLNHLFQPAETGSIAEYASIEQTMDPGVIRLVRRWVRDHAGLTDAE